MNPILIIGLVFLVLLACGVVFDLSGAGWMLPAATSASRHATPAAPPNPTARWAGRTSRAVTGDPASSSAIKATAQRMMAGG